MVKENNYIFYWFIVLVFSCGSCTSIKYSNGKNYTGQIPLEGTLLVVFNGLSAKDSVYLDGCNKIINVFDLVNHVDGQSISINDCDIIEVTYKDKSRRIRIDKNRRVWLLDIKNEKLVIKKYKKLFVR